MNLLSLSQLDYVVFDLETTGLYCDSGDEIIEVGAVLIEKGELKDSYFHSMVNPKRPIPAASSAVNGIKDEDVATAPTIDEVLNNFCRFVGSRVLVAHNAKFDMGFVLKGLQRLQLPNRFQVVIDTVAMSKLVFPYEQYHNLDALMARLGIPRTGDRHRSLDDCRYTAKALLELILLLEKQGIRSLPEIEAALVRADSLIKTNKPKTRSLFT